MLLEDLDHKLGIEGAERLETGFDKTEVLLNHKLEECCIQGVLPASARELETIISEPHDVIEPDIRLVEKLESDDASVTRIYEQ